LHFSLYSDKLHLSNLLDRQRYRFGGCCIFVFFKGLKGERFVMKKLLALVLPIAPVVQMVVVIMASAPAATSATMFAEKYDCDAAYVSRLVTASTLISIVTMPLVLLLV
jgi:predicted permease